MISEGRNLKSSGHQGRNGHSNPSSNKPTNSEFLLNSNSRKLQDPHNVENSLTSKAGQEMLYHHSGSSACSAQSSEPNFLDLTKFPKCRHFKNSTPLSEAIQINKQRKISDKEIMLPVSKGFGQAKTSKPNEFSPQNSESNVISLQYFFEEHPELCSNGTIIYPIDDSLFIQYQGLEPFFLKKSDCKPFILPPYFSFLLQVWNLFKTFSTYFGMQQKQITLKSMLSKILEKSQFMKLLTKILSILVKQFMNEKNQLVKRSKHYDFFNMLRFCSQNGLIDKIFARCWPILLLNIMQVLQFKTLNSDDQLVVKSLESLSIAGDEELCPSIETRMKILAIIIRFLVDTSQLRKAIQANINVCKNQLKKKNQLLEKKKIFHKQLSKLEQLEYQVQKKLKQYCSPSLLHQTQLKKYQNDLKVIQNGHKKKNELLSNLNKIQNEVQQIEKQTVLLTYVQFIGQDKDRNFYWKILAFPDLLFVNSGQNWGFYSLENIQKFIQNLNLRGSRQNHLYRALNSCFNFQQQPKSQKIFLQFLQLEVGDDNKKIQNKLVPIENSSIYQQLLTLLTQSEKKFSLYLQQRNSRWGSETERECFLQFMASMKQQSINSISQTLKNFNQKICVVQSQYRLIQQQSAQQLDTKVRKVQTKIWGISEKYKNHWVKLCSSDRKLWDIFFLIFVLCFNIQKYTSKNRKKRKQFQIVKQHNRYLKTRSCRSDDLNWEELCLTCNEGGQLLCCDMCPKVYHLQCLNLQQAPKSIFICDLCNKGRNIRKLLRNSQA